MPIFIQFSCDLIGCNDTYGAVERLNDIMEEIIRCHDVTIKRMCLGNFCFCFVD